jgi:nucleoside ABC transporter ATP-binding protein
LSNGDDSSIVVMKNIVKIYPDGTPALRGVDLELRKGEIHGLLGENGAGKTTLMKILSGLIKPTLGEIYIKGKRISLRNPAHALSLGIGMVHQHLSLVPVFTVYENIVLGLKGAKPSKVEIEKLMNTTGLKVPLDSVTENLSLGVRQRAEILKNAGEKR